MKSTATNSASSSSASIPTRSGWRSTCNTKEVKFLGKTLQGAYPILTAAPAQK